MTMRCLAAGGSPAGSLITPSNGSTGANWTSSAGLLSSLALMVGAGSGITPLFPGPLTKRAVSSGQKGHGGWSQYVGQLVVPLVVFGEGAGVRTVHVVHGFPYKL